MTYLFVCGVPSLSYMRYCSICNPGQELGFSTISQCQKIIRAGRTKIPDPAVDAVDFFMLLPGEGKLPRKCWPEPHEYY